jgi:hypothetical protein
VPEEARLELRPEDPSDPLGSFLGDRFSEGWDGGEPRRLDRTVSGVIGSFRPRAVPPEAWARVEEFVRQAVTTAEPEAPLIADHEMTVVAQLVLWSDRIGLPLVPKLVFNREHIDRFLLEGVPHLTKGSKINYRTHLWRVGRAVLGPEHFPPKTLAGQRSDVVAPYTAEEVSDLWSWARGRPTPHMRRNLRALLSIGLGSGLSSEEIQRLVGTDVARRDGVVVVDVIGQRARTVPVLDEWADEVWALAQESGERPFFCPERSRITRRDVIGFIERASGEEGDRFNVQALRVTWIVEHLSRATHLLRLRDWAGVGAGQLVKYLDFATLPDERGGTG